MLQHIKTLAIAMALVVLTGSIGAQSSNAAEGQSLLVMTASEDAEGATQSDFTPQLLKAMERKTVETIRAKAQAHLKSTGQTTKLPPFQSESHYVSTGGMKLAIVRIKLPGSVNQVIVFGIRGTELHRVACVRTSDFDLSIPIFSGACGDKLREVLGVSIPIK
jgi:hypothetical protein